MFSLCVLLPLRLQKHRKGNGTFNGRHTNGLPRISSKIDYYIALSILIEINYTITFYYKTINLIEKQSKKTKYYGKSMCF